MAQGSVTRYWLQSLSAAAFIARNRAPACLYALDCAVPARI